MRFAPVYSFLAALILTRAVFSEPLPPALADAGIEERLGASINGGLSFRDEGGHEVKLNDYLSQGKPLLLNFAYFHCPMLCGLVQDGMVKGLKKLDWVPGRQYQILTVSMDWKEGPAEALPVKKHLLETLGKPEAESGWHVLTGERSAVEELAGTVGFKYNYLPDRNEFAHGAGLIFLSPKGTVSRYLYGVEFSPRDLRLALLDASEGRSLSLGDKLTMFCYRYDSNSKGYVLFARNFMKAGGVLVTVLLASLLIVLWRQESKRKRWA
ncbi:MAG TPA: SCO family protein [Fibrobacteres bacterium]|jgi:protein SCO1/2|nr:SCO family protein [Fibrobacterota bacterium]